MRVLKDSVSGEPAEKASKITPLQSQLHFKIQIGIFSYSSHEFQGKVLLQKNVINKPKILT